jgi:hypothetical protein
MKKCLFIWYCFLLGTAGFCQNLYPSVLKVETTVRDKTISGESLSAMVQVSESTSEIALSLDASTLTTNNDTLNAMLQKIRMPIVYARGFFPIKNLSFVDNNNEEQRDFSGTFIITINGISREQAYTCTVYNLIGEDEFSLNNMAYPLRINLYFQFDPEDFGLNNYYKPLVNGITAEISKGLINKLNANGKSLFITTR